MYKKLFQKQKVMRTVLISLIPIYLFSVYLFGLRLLLLGLIVLLTGTVTEYLILRNIHKKNARVSEAVYVSCILYTLTLPPTIPFWAAMLGIAFGIFFGKGVFGGFGMNIFNPALVGRCFVYISFTNITTNTWAESFSGFPGGFVHYVPFTDMITSATPLELFLDTGKTFELSRLFFGNIPGSAGETSALLIIIACIYLLYKKAADYRIIVSMILSFIIVSSVFYIVNNSNLEPLSSLLSGSFLFGAVFMATDPISAPKEKLSKYAYGFLIGLLSFAIRKFSLFTEGVMFAILIANMFSPLIDRTVKSIGSEAKAIKEKG